jgi:hypothetical protein
VQKRSFRFPFLRGAPVAVVAFLVGCAASDSADDVASAEQEAVSDIARMTARGDGTFDVTCRDGRREIVSASDVQAGRVCTQAVIPASVFAAGACTGTPMTEEGALARLAGESSKNVGSFVLGLRYREYIHNAGPWDAQYRWKDAPQTATLVAWRETERSRAAHAAFGKRGSVELAVDATGEPYVRLVGEAANVDGPDTTRFMRLVSAPLRPWKTERSGPRFHLEESRGAERTWSRVTEYGWSVQTSDRNGSYQRSWWFEGKDVTAIVTESCGQFISAQPASGLSPVSAAIGIYVALD